MVRKWLGGLVLVFVALFGLALDGGNVYAEDDGISSFNIYATRVDCSFSGALDDLAAKGLHVDALDALTLAEKAGSAKAVNIVLMGRLAKYFGIPEEKWLAAIETTVAPKFVELNKEAFRLGYNA